MNKSEWKSAVGMHSFIYNNVRLIWMISIIDAQYSVDKKSPAYEMVKTFVKPFPGPKSAWILANYH